MKPKLENLEYLFKQGKPFQLTDAQYEKKTGLRLPKDAHYLLNKSALAKKCAEQGFTMELQEKVVTFKKK